MKAFIKNCINCGEEFDASRHPNQSTCSDECREALVRMNRTAPDGTALPRGIRRCIKCGEVFMTRNRRVNDPRFCSDACRCGYTVTCRYCGREFRGPSSSEFCNSECESYWRFDQRWEAEQKKLKSCACPACDEKFTGPGRFCSEYCRVSTTDLKRIMRGGRGRK